MNQRTTFRKVIHVMHLWVGVPCALFLFIICLSGTVYVFNTEIVRFIDRALYTVDAAPGSAPLPIAQLKTVVEKQKQGYTMVSVQIPERANEAWIVGLQPREAKEKIGAGKRERANAKTAQSPDEAAGKKKDGRGKPRPENFVVNPYTGQLLGSDKTPAARFFLTVMQLHRWLLMDNHNIGAAITGTASMLMVVLQITGLMLWFPARLRQWKNKAIWKQGFFVKLTASIKRINFDLHKTLGFYTFFFITIMALTGPVMGLEWYRTGFNKMLGVTPAPKGGANDARSSYPGVNARPLAVEELLATANTIYPSRSVVRISLPKDSSGTVGFQKMKAGFFITPGTDRVELDQYSGAVVKIDRFSDKTTAQQISALVKAIHTGEVFGTSSKILYFLACLMATSLPVTGVVIWVGRKRKGKRKVTVQTVRSAGGRSVAMQGIV